MKGLSRRLTGVVVAVVVGTSTATAESINLNTWTAESYDAVDGFDAGSWSVAPDGGSVLQTVNGQPTLFYSDFQAQNTLITGDITVGADAWDDDFVGFVFGFDPGDTTNGSADYLLVDWKAADQDFDFDSPSDDPRGDAYEGLAVSRVSGVPSADEFWQHTTYTGGGLTELARGTNLGSTGWAPGVTYSFSFVFLPDRFQLFVNGAKEIDILGAFADGRMGFYNFSQEDVTYSAFQVEEQIKPVSEPVTLTMLGTGLLAIGYRRRRR